MFALTWDASREAPWITSGNRLANQLQREITMSYANTLRACFVGAGKRALEHAEIMSKLPDRVLMVGVQDPSCSTNTEAWCKSYGLPMYCDLDRMLREQCPDFAVVCAPHDQHLDIVRVLALHGVHGFKEKPLGRSLDEGRRMLRLAEDAGIVLSVTMQRRFLSTYRRLHSELKALKEPRLMRGEYTIVTTEPASGWRGSRKRAGGGCLLDMGYHTIDCVVWNFGLPDMISASYDDPRHDDDIENEAVVNLSYSSGLTGELFISRCASAKSEYLRVIGADETLEAQRAFVTRNRHGKDASAEVLERGASDWTEAMVAQLVHFLEVIGGRATNHASAHSHLEHMAFVEACYLSKANGRPVNPKSLI